MGKSVFIAEKPSVAKEFAKALGLDFRSRDGYMESENTIVTWCVGHLVTMCYPDAYDEKYKKWALSTIPFIPDTYKYQVIDSVKKQFKIVSGILTSKDVETIYICTDSGREGEYIYRLVAQAAGVKGKTEKRVWIDSQTKEEIIRGIKEAKDDAVYNDLGAAAYLRAKEDYLMGINFSRALTLKYGNSIRDYLQTDRCVIAVGRVMTCVLGIVVKREREIRAFVKTPFYKVYMTCQDPLDTSGKNQVTGEWHVSPDSKYEGSPKLYKDNGFTEKETADELISHLEQEPKEDPVVHQISKKKETKNPPLLYNLAELQNDCSRFFKISPDETLACAQELYEKKLTTYPRTDARVLSTAVSKEIHKNLQGLSKIPMYASFVEEIMKSGSYRKIASTKYTNDKAITDHYAIIPTGQASGINAVSETSRKVFELICRRFLSIFYPAAIFDKITLQVALKKELFGASLKTCQKEGYLELLQYSFFAKKTGQTDKSDSSEDATSDDEVSMDDSIKAFLEGLKKGQKLSLSGFQIKEGETAPPKRYNSGSMILTMENAGQFIEDDELREQIKGSGIGTSATRAEILKKLVANKYLALNKKTQIITPTQLGEMIYDTVGCSLRPLLDPKLTASWEMGLTRVADGSVSEEEYRNKLNDFVIRRTNHVKETDFRQVLMQMYRETSKYYPEKKTTSATKGAKGRYKR